MIVSGGDDQTIRLWDVESGQQIRQLVGHTGAVLSLTFSPDGKRTFKCEPFTNIKEPECIAKWQLIRLDMLLASYQSMLKWYGKLAPIQDKLFKYMEREISELDEADSWKLGEEEEEEEAEQEDT